MLTLNGSTLPKKLSVIPDAPKNVYVEGADIQELVSRPTLAVVGSRRPTPYGHEITKKITSDLSKLGVCIVSGLALGVDSIAHRAVLDSGGTTIAVLPGGIKKVYPSSHTGLAKSIIASGGAVISERDDDYRPAPYDFLIRNRLVSGLSDAVLVTEAAERSGTLNTVKHALDQGKTVFAVPGNITSELSKGTNHLLKIGATPVTDFRDILIGMDWQHLEEANAKLALDYVGSPEEIALLDLIKSGVQQGAELEANCQLSPAEITRALTMLELSGIIRSAGGNSWTIIS
jgi:DNA processing protein